MLKKIIARFREMFGHHENGQIVGHIADAGKMVYPIIRAFGRDIVLDASGLREIGRTMDMQAELIDSQIAMIQEQQDIIRTYKACHGDILDNLASVELYIQAKKRAEKIA